MTARATELQGVLDAGRLVHGLQALQAVIDELSDEGRLTDVPFGRQLFDSALHVRGHLQKKLCHSHAICYHIVWYDS